MYLVKWRIYLNLYFLTALPNEYSVRMNSRILVLVVISLTLAQSQLNNGTQVSKTKFMQILLG